MENCLFCKMVNKEEPAEVVYNSSDLFAIKDINPQAPTHLLIIPKKHIGTLMDIEPEDQEVLGGVALAAKNLAEEFDLEMSGFRLVLNCGMGAGQTVFHVHYHLLGGRPMTWPPG